LDAGQSRECSVGNFHKMTTATNQTQLQKYDAMLSAITTCHRVDEVKEIHDKALALECYARQAMNIEAERQAAEIRIRAERHAGRLMRDLQRKPGQRTDRTSRNGVGKSSYRETLEKTGLDERTAQRW